jgi:hypothetical protein
MARSSVERGKEREKEKERERERENSSDLLKNNYIVELFDSVFPKLCL